MKAQIDSLFNHNNCLSISSFLEIRIKEINQIAQIIDSSIPNEHFKIENPERIDTYILTIDGCLKFKTNQKKCDFSFWSTNDFYFVEIKDTINRTSPNKRNAVNQLEKTIQYFFKNKIDFNNRRVYAVVSWSYNPSRPLASTTMQNHSFRFQKSYNTILLEGNNITIKD